MAETAEVPQAEAATAGEGISLGGPEFAFALGELWMFWFRG